MINIQKLANGTFGSINFGLRGGVCTGGRHMKSIRSHMVSLISISFQVSKRLIEAVFFFLRQLFLRTNSKFQPPSTLPSHNSGSKHRSMENHHIFRIARTSAFTWYSPYRVYQIRMSRKCGKHEKIQLFRFLGVPTVEKKLEVSVRKFLRESIENCDTLTFWGPRPRQTRKNQIRYR